MSTQIVFKKNCSICKIIFKGEKSWHELYAYTALQSTRSRSSNDAKFKFGFEI